MAELDLKLEQDVYCGEILGERFEFPATESNKYCLILFLRGFKKSSGKQGLFSQEHIARAVPDFDGNTRQSVDDHERRFRESGKDLKHYLTRKRKVDETVIEAVRTEVLEQPLRQTPELVRKANQRLKSEDLNASNITTALESISLADVRPVLRRQLEAGHIHYKESYLLCEMMRTYCSESGELAGLSVPEQSGMKICGFSGVKSLLTPDLPLSEVTVSLFWIAFMLRLFWQGVPLSVLAQWCHVHPTTVLRWILGLSLALWPHINTWLNSCITCTKAYIDEQWIKIRHTWYYWFVILDKDSGLPVYQALLQRRSKASVSWIVTQLRHIKQLPGTFISDGLPAYKSVCASLNNVTHVLYRFHHQQG